MKDRREDAEAAEDAVEAEKMQAAIEPEKMPAAEEGAVAATGGGAPSDVTAPVAVAAVEHLVGEQVQEDAVVDLERQTAKRKREAYERVDQLYEDAYLATRELPNRSGNFEEEVSDELPEEDSEDVDQEKESRDGKSRYVLRRLRRGEIPYRTGGYIACPFCTRNISKTFKSMIDHATGIGGGSEKKHAAHTKAKHAAFGLFLKKYVQPNEPFFIQPPSRPAKKAKN